MGGLRNAEKKLSRVKKPKKVQGYPLNKKGGDIKKKRPTSHEYTRGEKGKHPERGSRT